MRLAYKILWFEDEKSWFESMSPFIEEFLTDKGFDLVPNWFPNGEIINTILDLNDYDLILVDYSLPGKCGDDLIKRIRENNLFTDIIFYSQYGEKQIRSKIATQEIDGVFCSDRKTDKFEDKVTKIIQTTIKKVEDISNMRGLVMSETSELDILLEDIIRKILSKSYDDIGEWRTTIKNKTLKSHNDKCKEVEKIDETNIDELIPCLDSYNKYRTVKRLLKKINENNLFDNISIIFNDYETEVIKIRNLLAHVKEDTDEQGKKIFKSKMKGYETVEFNDKKFIEIRKNLLKHQDNISDLIRVIEQ